MKFTEIVVIFGIFSFFILNLFDGFLICKKLSETMGEVKNTCEAEKFITESFKKTCKGEGFNSLNEWQVTCRAMFSLDYIGWSNADDFMEVDYEFSKNKLFYGKWIGSGWDGEVYCRGIR